MKKILLLGAAALLSASAAFAQDDSPASETGYAKLGAITDAKQLKSGLYVLNAKETGSGEEGSLRHFRNDNGNWDSNIGYYSKGVFVGSGFISNSAFIWKVDVTSGEGTENVTFTLQNFESEKYFSVQGSVSTVKDWVNEDSYTARNNIQATDETAADGKAVKVNAILSLISAGTGKFNLHLTNARFSSNDTPSGNNEGHPNVYSNGSGNRTLSYWGPGTGGLEFEFCPVIVAEPMDVTVNFPSWNGNDVSQTVTAVAGLDVTDYITDYINSMGGMKNVTVKSDSDEAEDLIVTSDNNSFTVEGNWNDDFAPYQVYRIVVHPGAEETAALRYMLHEGYIQTRLGAKEATLGRMIPERLWYFVPGTEPNTYTLHNLYDQGSGVTFESNGNGVKATYTNNPTAFELVSHSADNQFYLRIAGLDPEGTQYYANDYSVDGYLCLYNSADGGSILRLDALSEQDMATIGYEGDPSDALSTNTAFIEALNDWNAHNINAAIRRIDYFCGEKLIGPNPGQFMNEGKDFLEKLEEAKELAAKVNNNEEVDETELKEITDAISWENLSFNEIVPGKFYRFKNVDSDLYISSTTTDLTVVNVGTNSYMDMVPAEMAVYSNTVFYLDTDGSLIGFDNGKVIGQFSGGDRNTWCMVLKSDNKRSPGVTIQHQDGGQCVIHTSGTGNTHRHLYGKCDNATYGNTVNCGGGFTGGYTWYVETVEELPIPLYHAEGEESWGSIYSPVELEIQNGEAVAHVAKFTGTTVEYTDLEDGSIVPANTPVLLDYKTGAKAPEREDEDPRTGISYIYLKINYPSDPSEQQLYYEGEEEVTPSTSEGKDLNGGIYAVAKAETGMNYYTLHATTTNNFREHTASAYEQSKANYVAHVPGFKAHIALADDEVPVAGEDGTVAIPIVKAVDNTNGIEEISAGNGVKAVYDLQGRKLAAPAKGINIVSGKKVLVK